MKRIIALIVSIVMLVSMAMPAFAKASPSRGGGGIHVYTSGDDGGPGVEITPAPDELVDDYLEEGPTGGKDPTGTTGTNKTKTGKESTKSKGISMFRYTRPDGIEAVLILTPYDDRSTIIYDKSRAEISEAHAEVEEAAYRLDTLTAGVRDKAIEAGTTVEHCYVTEIFDLTYYLILPDYVQSDDHGSFHITLGRDKLVNFVCLLHRYNGVWKVVPDAKVVGENEDTLEFSANIFSPFAVVVWGDEGMGSGSKRVKSPKTEDATLEYAAYAAGIIISMAAVGYVLIKGRKRA